MNIRVRIQALQMTGAVGVMGGVQKTLAIRTITLVIAPTACCAGVAGTAVRLTYAPLTGATRPFVPVRTVGGRLSRSIP